MIISVNEFQADAISFAGCFAIILLSADFFLPMRQLGSFFHIAMNGMAASDKIFRLLDLPDPEPKTATVSSDHYAIQCKDLRFSYNEGREILHGVHGISNGEIYFLGWGKRLREIYHCFPAHGTKPGLHRKYHHWGGSNYPKLRSPA